MSYFPFPVEEFRLYVDAMPNDQAKAALMFLAFFMTEGFTDTERFTWVRYCNRCNDVAGPSHVCELADATPAASHAKRSAPSALAPTTGLRKARSQGVHARASAAAPAFGSSHTVGAIATPRAASAAR